MRLSFKKRIVLISALAVLSILYASTAYAAEVYFRVVPSVDSGAAIIEARINPEGTPLNVVEGTISLNGEALGKVPSILVETGGSILSYWAVSPWYSPDEEVIRFVGGVPGGFSHDSLLFRVYISSSTGGAATLSWVGGSAYENDGKGTKEGIFSRSITVSLLPVDPNAGRSSLPDDTPPHFDALELGKDPSVYDGRYFLSFHATDDLSGVARYEVLEGEKSTSVTDGVYVLLDQERNTPITITAYDGAGNHATIQFSMGFKWENGIIILSIIFLLFVFFYVYKRKKYWM
ncbi:MAG: hypothetical protein NUV49_02885 [Patescibacteria group bacterium]|nr:hypothetical protein [Patescibacteria group bacterium]